MRRVAFALFGASAVLLIAAVVLVSGSRPAGPPEPITILRGQTSTGAPIVRLEIADCPRRIFTTVTQEPATVRVEISGDGSRPGGRCTRDLLVLLKAPLGDRPLVDAATGRAVPVETIPPQELTPPGVRPRPVLGR